MGIALRARCARAVWSECVDAARSPSEHLARHAGGERLLHRVARTEGRLRPRRAMQRRDRHRRRVSDRCREGRRDEDPRADAGVRVFLRRQRCGRRQDCGSGGSASGRRTRMTTVRSSGRRRPRRRAARPSAGVVGRVGWIVSGSISSVSGRSKSLDDRQQAGLAGGIVDGLGRDVRRGRRRRREDDRRSAAGGGGRGSAGGVNFIGSMMVCPVDWSCSTSQSLSSSSTGGHTSDGAALSSVGSRCRPRSGSDRRRTPRPRGGRTARRSPAGQPDPRQKEESFASPPEFSL